MPFHASTCALLRFAVSCPTAASTCATSTVPIRSGTSVLALYEKMPESKSISKRLSHAGMTSRSKRVKS